MIPQGHDLKEKIYIKVEKQNSNHHRWQSDGLDNQTSNSCIQAGSSKKQNYQSHYDPPGTLVFSGRNEKSFKESQCKMQPYQELTIQSIQSGQPFTQQQQIEQQNVKNRQKKISFQQKNNYLQTNETIYHTRYYSCNHCTQQVKDNVVSLNCQHFFHEVCFNELILTQIKIGQSRIKCYCGISIEDKFIRFQFKENLSIFDQLMKNQLKQIKNDYQYTLVFHCCENCDVFWISQNHKIKLKCCKQCQK